MKFFYLSYALLICTWVKSQVNIPHKLHLSLDIGTDISISPNIIKTAVGVRNTNYAIDYYSFDALLHR